MRMREGKSKRERGESFHLLVYTPNGHSCEGLAQTRTNGQTLLLGLPHCWLCRILQVRGEWTSRLELSLSLCPSLSFSLAVCFQVLLVSSNCFGYDTIMFHQVFIYLHKACSHLTSWSFVCADLRSTRPARRRLQGMWRLYLAALDCGNEAVIISRLKIFPSMSYPWFSKDWEIISFQNTIKSRLFYYVLICVYSFL